METNASQKPLRDSAPELARHIENVRRSLAANALRTGLLTALPILVAWLAVTMPLDWLLELPRLVRAGLFFAGIGGAFFVAWRFGIRDWLQRADDEKIALRIEKALPEFRSRLIASVQLSSEDDTPLVRALISETEQLAVAVPLKNVVDRSQPRRWAKVSFGLLLAGGIAWSLGGKASSPLFLRALLVEREVPRKTQVLGFSGNRIIAVGDDLRIEATAGGVVPKSGILRITTASGKKQELAFEPVAGSPNQFFRTLQSVQQPFDYTLLLGDNQSARGRVKVQPRPSVTKVDCEQLPPAYTKLPPKSRPMSDLKVLAGSKLRIRLKASASLRSATVRFLAADRKTVVRDTALKPVISAPTAGGLSPLVDWEVLADVPTREATGLTFALVDEDGIESKGGAVYRLEVTPDEAPTVRILWPQRREELLTRGATLLVSFEAKDDFGISKMRLNYGVNWNTETPPKVVDLDLSGETPRSLVRRFDWDLNWLALQDGDIVEFWLEAVDGNNVTGPGIGRMSEHYQARIVSEADKRADLSARLDDTLRGLNDLKQGQEDLSKRLGEMIQIRPQ